MGTAAVRWREWTSTGTGSTVAGDTALRGEAALERATQILAGGGILVHPTSTVYGIGGRPDPDVDARIAAIKGREPGPLIRLAASRREIREALPALRWPACAARLAASYWPGPLTLILDDGSETGVAVRVDSHPVVRALLERAGGLMTSTSLNATGEPPARTVAEVRATLHAMDPGVGAAGWLEAGPSRGAPSTLVSVRDERATVLREGTISASEIEAASR